MRQAPLRIDQDVFIVRGSRSNVLFDFEVGSLCGPPQSANFVGFNWVLAREGMGWDLNEFGARVSLLAAGELVECLSNLILMHMLGSICY